MLWFYFGAFFLLMLSSKITIRTVYYLFQDILDHHSKYIYILFLVFTTELDAQLYKLAGYKEKYSNSKSQHG